MLATLVVYAYTSFTAAWGPGPTLAKNFETQCQCHVNLVAAGDGGALLGRLKLEGETTEADVVIGFDGTFIPKLKKISIGQGHSKLLIRGLTLSFTILTLQRFHLVL